MKYMAQESTLKAMLGTKAALGMGRKVEKAVKSRTEDLSMVEYSMMVTSKTTNTMGSDVLYTLMDGYMKAVSLKGRCLELESRDGPKKISSFMESSMMVIEILG